MKKILLFIVLLSTQSIYGQRTDCFFASSRAPLDSIAHSVVDGWIHFNPLIVSEEDLFADSKTQTLGVFSLDTDNRMEEITRYSTNRGGTEFKSVKYQQSYKDIPVECGVLIGHWEDCVLKILNGHYACDLDFDLTNLTTASAAIAVGLAANPSTEYIWENTTEEQAYRDDEDDQTATHYPTPELLINCDDSLVYRFYVTSLSPSFYVKVEVSAISGNVLSSISDVKECFHKHSSCDERTVSTYRPPALYRSETAVNSTSGSTLFNGTQPLITKWSYGKYRLKDNTIGADIETRDAEGSLSSKSFGSCKKMTLDQGYQNNVWNPADVRTTSVHWSVSNCKRYFFDEHGTSVGAGEKLKVRANFGSISCGVASNLRLAAYFPGEKSLMFSGLSGGYFGVLDVVGHEFTHFAADLYNGLLNSGESGALGESFADIFGYMIDRDINGASDWDIGEKSGFVVRNMENPATPLPRLCGSGTTVQPDTYLGPNWFPVAGCFPTNNNNGCGIHTNMGVQNKWFSLLSEGGSHNGISVQGITQESAAEISWYNFQRFMTPNSQYADSRNGSIEAAKILFGDCSFEHIQTQKAWQACGIGSTNNCIGFDYGVADLQLCDDDSNLPRSFTFSGVFSEPVSWIPDPVFVFENGQNTVYSDPSNWTYAISGTFNETISIGSVSNAVPERWYRFRIEDSSGAIIGTAGFQILDCGGIIVPPNPTDKHLCSYFTKVAGRSNGTLSPSGEILQNKTLADRNDKSVAIRPNPFASDFKVENAVGSTYEVLDASGSVISRGNISTQDETISVDNLAQGIYILRLTDQHKFVTVHRIVKK